MKLYQMGQIMNVFNLNSRQLQNLSETQIFKGVSIDDIKSVLSEEMVVLHSYQKGQLVYQPDEYSRSLVYILNGSALISTTNGSSGYQMRKIKENEFFGVAALFNDEDKYVSQIKALKNMDLIFFQEQIVQKCITKYPRFALNYVSFLTDRIRFLNKKIRLITASSNKNRVIEYLLSHPKQLGDSFKLEISLSQLSKNLNMGRSSLYRVLDELESNNIIHRDGKNISLRDYEKLQEYFLKGE